MKNGNIEIGKYSIKPRTSIGILQIEDFKIISTKEGMVYIANSPMRICDVEFWVNIYEKESLIRRIEIANANEKYRMNYKQLDSNMVEELITENKNFLLKNIGKPSRQSITGFEYVYNWGKIVLYYDNKSGETGIVIDYLN